jgi:hypothetical protein
MRSNRARETFLAVVCVLALAADPPRTTTPREAFAQAPGPGPARGLAGHWRNTRIVLDSPRDDNLVLKANGQVERWSVTPTSRSGIVRGRWSSEANTLSIDWDDGNRWTAPFTFHEGELVFPNRQGQRRFWKRIQ